MIGSNPAAAKASTPQFSPEFPADRATLLDHALAYARRGWSIIAVIDKKPAGLWKPFQVTAAHEKTLRRLFARADVTGLAVVTGQVSGGLAIRDWDDAEAYHAWARANPEEAGAMPTAQSARGFHGYGLLDDEKFAVLGDGELRGDSLHYTLLPPSRHPSSHVYCWLNPLPPPSETLHPLPLSLVQTSVGMETQQPKQLIACVTCAAIDAIAATLPSGPGQRNRRVFDLARRLKGTAGLDTSPAALKTVVSEWHRQALPVITTKAFAETWSDFQTAWLAVRVPHGTAVRAAYEAARRRPAPPIDGNKDLGVLAAMCRLLGAGGKTYYLSCETAGELFDVSRMTAWRWLNALQFHGVIELVKVGTKKDGQASTWRYTAG